MAKMDTWQLPAYISDLGQTVQIAHKLKLGLDDCVDALGYEAPDADVSVCNSANIPFSPRYISGKFVSGARVGQSAKFLLQQGNPSAIQAAVQALRICGLGCMNYVGESWATIPTTLVNYTPGEDPFVLQEGGPHNRVGGVITYASDVLGGAQRVRIGFENDPAAFAQAVRGCTGAISETAACTPRTGIKPRAIVAHGYTVKAADNSGAPATGQVRRLAPIGQESQIAECALAIGNLDYVSCVGLQGELIKGVDLLVP